MRMVDFLGKRYPITEYVIMEEVSDAAGSQRSRSADYIVCGLWPSRGLPVIGIEQKESRADWLREYKDHKKCENIFQYCDQFWLFTSDESIAKIEEIPAQWGWFTVKGEKIITKKDAPKLTPVSLSKGFIISMLRRAADKSKFVHVDSIENRIRLSFERGKSQGDYTLKATQTELSNIRSLITEFESLSGIRISKYGHSKELATALDFISKEDSLNSTLAKIQRLKKEVDAIAFTLEQSLSSLESYSPVPVKSETA